MANFFERFDRAPGEGDLPAPARDRRTSAEAGLKDKAALGIMEQYDSGDEFDASRNSPELVAEIAAARRRGDTRALAALEEQRSGDNPFPRPLANRAPAGDNFFAQFGRAQPKGPDFSPDALKAGASGDYFDALGKGISDLGTSLKSAKWVMTGGDTADMAKSLAAQIADARASAGEQEIQAGAKAVNDASGAWDTAKAIGGLLWSMASNPYDTGKMVVQNLPNAAPSMIMGAAGAAAGSAVVPGVGGLVGGMAGLGAGSATVEFGAKLADKVQDALQAKKLPPTAENIAGILDEPGFRDSAMQEGAAKGITIGTIDMLSAAVGGRIATAPFRAATRKVLTSAGVDVADTAAVNAALKTAPVQAAIKAEVAAIPTSRKVGMGAAGIGVDSAMEGVGEYAGEAAATGQGKLGDAILEAFTSLGQSTAEVGGSYALQRGSSMINPREAAVADIAKATTPDQAIEAFTRATAPAPAEPPVEFDRLGAFEALNARPEAPPPMVGPQHPLGDPNAIPYDYSTPAQRFPQLPAPEDNTGSGVLINDTDPQLTRPERFGDREARINTAQQAREEDAYGTGVRDIVQTPEGPRRRPRVTLDEAGNIIDAPDEHRPFLSLVRREARPHAAAAIEAHAINPDLTEAALAAPNMGPRAERTVFEAIIHGRTDTRETRALLERHGIPGRLADANGQGTQPGAVAAPGQQPVAAGPGQAGASTGTAGPDRQPGVIRPPGEIPVKDLQTTTPATAVPLTERTDAELRLQAKNTRAPAELKAISDELARRKLQASPEGKAPPLGPAAQPPAVAPATSNLAPKSKHPNMVIRQVRDRNGNMLGTVMEPYDGTIEGARKAAKAATKRMYYEYPDAGNVASRMGSTDENGNPKWAISPNFAYISPVDSVDGRATFGDDEAIRQLFGRKEEKDVTPSPGEQARADQYRKGKVGARPEHEMSLADWRRQWAAFLKERSGTDVAAKDISAATHLDFIEAALEEGKTVPAEAFKGHGAIDAKAYPLAAARAGEATKAKSKTRAKLDAQKRDLSADEIARQIQDSIAENAIANTRKALDKDVAKGYKTREEADRRLAQAAKEWEGVKVNERTQELTQAIADKDPRRLVGVWANEGQGTFGNEGAMRAFEKMTGVKLLKLNSAERAKAIFDWAGWSKEQVAEDVAKRRADKEKRDAERGAKAEQEREARVISRAEDEKIKIRETGEVKSIRTYVDDLIAQGYNRVVAIKRGAATRHILANESESGFVLPAGTTRDYAEIAVKNAVPAETPPPKTEKQPAPQQPDEILKRLGFNTSGPGPGEWVLAISKLGDVIAKPIGNDQFEVSADYMGKRFATETVSGEAALSAKVEEFTTKINEGREKMAQQFVANERGLPTEIAGFAKGDRVRFTVPGARGPQELVGRVDRIMPTGAIEVRSQQGGIYALLPSDLKKVEEAPTTQAAPPENRPKRAANYKGRMWRDQEGNKKRVLDSTGNEQVIVMTDGKVGNTVMSVPELEALIAADTAPKQEAPSDRKEIGKNSKGETLYEDARGVRVAVRPGESAGAQESVQLVPTRQGIKISRGEREDRFKTVEELDAEGQQDELPPEMRAYEAKAEAAEKAKSAGYGATNTVFTADAAEKARALLRKKLGQINVGIDPEVIQAGIQLAGYHVEAGARKFGQFTKAMIDDLGEVARPFLKSWYLAVRNYPGFDASNMNSEAEIETWSQVENQAAPAQNAAKEPQNGPSTPPIGSTGNLALEEPSSGDVRPPQGGRNAGSRGASSGAANNGRKGQPDASGDTGGRGLGNGAGTVPVPTGGAGGKPGSAAVERIPGSTGNQPPAVQPGQRGPVEKNPQATGDYRITSLTKLGEGGPKAKYTGNLAAIRLVKTLQAEGRGATPDEQHVLARYVGWGGIPQAFDKDNEKWAAEYRELKAALTPDEWQDAFDSTQFAHYTSENVIGAMYQALQRLGFKGGGRFLEAGSGVGNFVGLAPKDMLTGSRFTGIERDAISGTIAKYLYPNQSMQVADFTRWNAADGTFDVSIGNPPFSRNELTDASGRKHLSRLRVHNYFFGKSVDLLREGGIFAEVVSNGFMDSRDDRARKYIGERTRLLGAIRLPNNAFKGNAGTEVTTDIVFLQKLPAAEWGSKAAKEDAKRWMDLVEVPDPLGGKPIPVNRYFAVNPDMMLGSMERAGSMYGPDQPALIARDGADIAKELARAVKSLPENVYQSAAVTNTAAMQKAQLVAMSGVTASEGGYFVRDGQLYQRAPDIAGEQFATKLTPETQWTEKTALGAARHARLTDLAHMAVLTRQLIAAEISNAEADTLTTMRVDLNSRYDAYVKAYGPLNTRANLQLYDEDPDLPLLLSLERDFDPGITESAAKKQGIKAVKPSAQKADILTKRVNYKREAPDKADSPADAVMISIAERGVIDAEYIADLLGQNADGILAELAKGDKPALFLDPATNGYVLADEYLSGNVRKKLLQAKAAHQFDNVRALEAVIPKDIPSHDIVGKLGAGWIPTETYEQFARELFGEGTDAQIRYIKANSSFVVDIGGGSQIQEATTWGIPDMPGSRILANLLNNKEIKVGYYDDDHKFHLEKDKTDAANDKAAAIRERFGDWLMSAPERSEMLTRQYNDVMNNYVAREYDGSMLRFPGKVPDEVIKFRKHQRNAIARIMQDRQALLDHVVGAGKTYTIVSAAMELRRTGLARKPLITVPNHLVKQWGADFYRLYPGAKILAATKKDFEKVNRRRFLAKIATGDWDAVILAHSSFGFIKPPVEFEEVFAERQIAHIIAEIEAMGGEAGKGRGDKNDTRDSSTKRTVKQLAAMRDRLKERVKRLRDKPMDDLLDFEQLGVDMLMVDEAHLFKNLMYATKMQNVRGMGSPEGSQRAYDMYIKTQYIMEKYGKGVVFATGTPVSNSLAEMYHMLRYLAPATLADMKHETFDAWANTFASVEQVWMQALSGEGFKATTRLDKFVNAPELLKVFGTVADTVTMDDIKEAYRAENEGKEFPLPPLKGDRRTPVSLPITQAQKDFMADIAKRAKALEQRKGPPKKGEDNMLSIMGDARRSAIDIRMVDPDVTERDPNGRLAKVAANVLERYRKYNDVKGTQLIFSDLGTPLKHARKELAEYEELQARAAPLHDESIRARAEFGDEEARKQIEDAEKAVAEMEANGKDWLDGIKIALRGFSVYDDLRKALIEGGVPENEIAFIHDYNTDEQKAALFKAVNQGKVRVLLGSTAKMGAGTNVQERLVALHHVDVPWKPSDIEQREGRIVRQGNELPKLLGPDFAVEILAYVTQDTLDLFMWQLQEAKLSVIGQIRTGKVDREIDNAFEEMQMSAGEMQAAATSDPLLMKEIRFKDKIKKLERQKKSFEGARNDVINRTKRAEADVQRLPAQIERAEAMSQAYRRYLDGTDAWQGAQKATVNGTEVTGAQEIRSAVLDGVKGIEIPVFEKYGYSFAMKTKGEKAYLQEMVRKAWQDTGVEFNGKTYHSESGLGDAVRAALGDYDTIAFTTPDGEVWRNRRPLESHIERPVMKALHNDESATIGKFGDTEVVVEGAHKGGKVYAEVTLKFDDREESVGSIEFEDNDKLAETAPASVIASAHRALSNSISDASYLKSKKEEAERAIEDARKNKVEDAWPKEAELTAARAEYLKLLKDMRTAGSTKDFSHLDALYGPNHGIDDLMGPMASRGPSEKFRATTILGQPAFSNQYVHLMTPEQRGGDRYSWRIYSNDLTDEGGDPLYLGYLIADYKDGKFTALQRIEIDPTLQGRGIGETVVASMLRHNGMGFRMEVVDIQHAQKRGTREDPLPFWKKLGTVLTNFSSDPDIPMNGVISLEDYRDARGNEPQAQRQDRGGNARAGSEAPQSRRQAGGQGQTVGQVRQELTAAFGERGIAALERAGILTITTWADAPADLTGALQSGDHGAYWPAKGKGFIFADNARPGEAVSILLHEIGEHYGLEEMLGRDAYASVVQQVKTLHKAGNPAIRAAWEHVARHYDDTPGGKRFMHEVIARAGQDAKVHGMHFWKRLMDGIRAFLVKIGMKSVRSQADLQTLLRASLGRAMREAGRQSGPVAVNVEEYGMAARLSDQLAGMNKKAGEGLFEGAPELDSKGAAVKRIRLDRIEHGESAMPGGKMTESGARDRIADYAARNTPFPPIELLPPETRGGKYMVYDGSHRLEAARLRRDKTIEATIVGETPMASRGTLGAAVDTLRSDATQNGAMNTLSSLFDSSETFNLWNRTVGTQFHKAKKDADFARVFKAVNNQIQDTSRYAIEAEQEAPNILQRLESVKDIGRAILQGSKSHQADMKAMSRAVFADIEGEQGVKQQVFTDAQLRARFDLTDRQIELYREFRRAVDASLDRLAQSTAMKAAQPFMEVSEFKNQSLDDTVEGIVGAFDAQLDQMRGLQETLTAKPTAAARREVVRSLTIDAQGNLTQEYVRQPKAAKALLSASDKKLAKELAAQIKVVEDAKARIVELRAYSRELQAKGYAPAMRFGRFAVSVGDPLNPDFFGMYETQAEANMAALALKREFPGADVTKSVVNDEAWKMFQGVSPETVELFARFMGADESEGFKQYISLATSSRSAMKRMLERKGVSGFSWDASRVLAQFVTSNARQASINVHAGEMNEAVQAIPREKGDVQKEAQNLVDYVRNPKEEAATLRNLLFMHYMGGSLASAVVNLTQPVLQTAPYLSQFIDAGKLGKIMVTAAKEAVSGHTSDPGLRAAMQRANADGITQPHEIHQLMADAQGSAFGKSARGQAFAKAWGGFFALSEAYNRRLTFMAAYQVGRAAGKRDAYGFAVNAVFETQGLYNKANRPNWARGAIGATLFTFKQFSISYLEFLSRLPPKQLLIALAVLTIAAGIEGLPFAEDIEDIIDTAGQRLGYATNSKKALRKAMANLLGDGAAEFALHGFSALPGFPLDVSARLGMSNLIPGTRAFDPSKKDKGREILEVFGAAGGLAKGVMDAADSGRVSDAIPTAVRNAWKSYEMLSTGEYRDSKGRKVRDVDALDAAVKAIGFQPASVAADSRRVGEQIRDVDIAKHVESEIAQDWARGILEKHPEGVKAARQRLADWNKDNPDMPIRIKDAQILKRVKEARLTRDQRFIKTVPPEMRRQVMMEITQ